MRLYVCQVYKNEGLIVPKMTSSDTTLYSSFNARVYRALFFCVRERKKEGKGKGKG